MSEGNSLEADEREHPSETPLQASERRAQFAVEWLEKICQAKIGVPKCFGFIRLEIPIEGGVFQRVKMSDETSYK